MFRRRDKAKIVKISVKKIKGKFYQAITYLIYYILWFVELKLKNCIFNFYRYK